MGKVNIGFQFSYSRLQLGAQEVPLTFSTLYLPKKQNRFGEKQNFLAHYWCEFRDSVFFII